jgi:hypothetical protein
MAAMVSAERMPIRPVSRPRRWRVLLILVALISPMFLAAPIAALFLIVAVMPGCLR